MVPRQGYTAYLCYFLLCIAHPSLGRLDSSQVQPKPNGVEVFRQYEDIEPEVYHKKKRIAGTYKNGKHLDKITVVFTAFNKYLILDLSLNKDLFSTSYIEKRYHSFGSSIHQPHVLTQRKKHCYYHGEVRYSPGSMVALSTCDGLRGLIATDTENYHIDPVNGTLHRIFRDSDRKKGNHKCGTDNHRAYFHPARKDQHERKKRSIPGPYDSNQNTRYVELFLVNDYRTFEKQHLNVTTVIRRSQEITNIVSRLYRPLNIYVALVGVEVWEEGDQVTVTSSADTTMENFLRYRRERINPYHRNDNAQLITGQFFEHGVVGKAIKGPICTYQFSGGVNMDYDGLVTLVATTVAHEMGHNFGMEHDNDSTCYCQNEKCIMAATSGQTSPTHWSACSKTALEEAFELGMDYCLKNKPTQIFEGPVCGNGFVEDGEECDCGLPQDCNNICCNATTCKLYHQAKCATGRCCDLKTCQVKEKSTLCREPTGECDLPEFCDGNGEYCPNDVTLQDGLSCKNGQSYCYKGKCNTHTDQCKLLWGDTGRASDPICFQQLNIRGDQDGNCGYNWTTDRYATCRREDVMCGLLHCVHLNEKLMFWRDNLAKTMRASFLTRGNTQYVCRSAMLDVGLDMPDPGMVPEGAKCEVNKICVNHKCVPLHKMDIPQCSTGCNGKGVCNSMGNCHCQNGFAPPYCDRPGYGGSVDSGPSSNEYANKSLLVGLLVFFLVILPLIGVIVFFGYFYRYKLKKWWNLGPKLKYGVPGKKPKPPPQPVRSPSNVQEPRPKPPPMKRPPTQVLISDPVLTGSTNRESHAFVAPPRPSLSPKHERVPVKIDPVVPASAKIQPKPEKLSQRTDRNAAKTKPDRPSNKPERVASKSERLAPPDSCAKILKRESFRGTDISSPVLMSTTNRNSDVFPEDEFHEIPGQSQLVPRSSGSRSPPPLSGHGTTPRVKRTQSDRPKVDRPLSIPPSKGALDRQSAVSTSMRTQRPPAPPPRPLPPDPRTDSDGPVYQNEYTARSKGPVPAATKDFSHKKDIIHKKDQVPKKDMSYNKDSSQKRDISHRKDPAQKKESHLRDKIANDHRTPNSTSNKNKRNDPGGSVYLNIGTKSDKPKYSNLASPEGDLDLEPKEHSSVSALRAKFGASDSNRSGNVGRSNSRVSDRPSIASKPSPKVVRSFNV